MATSSSQTSKWDKHFHKFDIDNYLNYVVPKPRLYLLPRPISHFLGYRPHSNQHKAQLGNPFVWLSGCIGGFIGIAIITAVYHALPQLDGHQVPVVIASFGAAAILEYNTIESPLSQPRNLIIGHFLAALVGVSITKLFEHLPAQRFEDLRWLAGAVSVGLASFVMGFTKTIHPPAGATALLAATSADVTALGWWLLPLILLASILMAASALLVNNLTRRWPLYWWTPVDLSQPPRKNGDIEHVADTEKHHKIDPSKAHSNDLAKIRSTQSEDSHIRSTSGSTLRDEQITGGSQHRQQAEKELEIVIGRDMIVLPDWFEASDWERAALEALKQRLQDATV